MKLLKRKEMPLYILMCEAQTYRQFQDVFGKDFVNKLFLHSICEDEINDSFSVLMHKLFENNISIINKCTSCEFNSIDEAIDYIEKLLDMADEGKPLHEGEFVFQFFLPAYNKTGNINWGLRGHPFLYAGIARKLSREEANDIDERAFAKLYFDAYLGITGRKLEPGETFYVEELDPKLGGMSAGYIYPEWFLMMLGIIKERIEQS